ncbi:hypothetical protein F511_31940 [Dorcoceras hygrometricum]|uniref:Uncharacterized protein n=1 Tax=Dorcoceras hygrometricum TaxID=472368 RepID=A0A2Z7AFB5_9LAMI|nr:hypothetical protein F511_31940 [Dorcoceras hygrometricum]
MGCPGQARTKPRRKNQLSQRRREITDRRPPPALRASLGRALLSLSSAHGRWKFAQQLRLRSAAAVGHVSASFVQPVRATAPTDHATCVAIARPARYHARSCVRGGAPPYAAAPWPRWRLVSYLAGDLCLAPTRIARRSALHGRRLYIRQSGPRPEGRLLRQHALEGLTRSARTDSPRKVGRSNCGEGRRRRRVAGTAAAATWRGGRRPRCARVRSCEL